MKNEINILIVDDDEDDFIIIRDVLLEINNFTFEIDWESDYKKAFDKICSFQHDVYLIDYRLGERTGIELLKDAIAHDCRGPMIILTGAGHEDIDYQAMKEGASDYLVKGGINSEIIERSIRYSIRQAKTINELREEREKYRDLFQKSIDAIFITDQKARFLDANQSMLKMLGINKEEILRREIRDVCNDNETYERFMEKLSTEGVVKSFECALKNDAGDLIDCIVTVSSIKNPEGELVGYQGVIHDISERKKVQKELMMAERLSMTGKLARTIAHEIRNPLTNLNLALDQLAEEVASKESDLYLDIIQRNVDRIDQLIKEMLSSSKPGPLDLKEYCLNDVLDLTLHFTHDRINLRGIKLVKNYEPSLPSLLLDAEKIKIALLNIIINAIEAMEPDKGTLEVATYMEKGIQVITIKDNGKGIPPQNIEKLFDPFFTNKQNGMGLGLTSTQTIIQSHKGEIEVSSEEGKGTIFKILLY